MRTTWIASRRGHANVSQMHYARQDIVTEEMAYAVGLYGGTVMNLGASHYCPEYQPDVQQALSSL